MTNTTDPDDTNKPDPQVAIGYSRVATTGQRSRRHHPTNFNPAVAIGYARISKVDKNETEEDLNNSIEAQEADMNKWCAQQGIKLIRIERDMNVSGGKAQEERDGLQRALQGMKEEKAGILLVAKRDRLARDALQASLLEQKVVAMGAKIASVDGIGSGSQPTDIFQRQVLDAVYELERAMIRARTKRALTVKRERGEQISGTPPYGYTFGPVDAASEKRHTIPVAEEQTVIARILELRKSGVSYNRIAKMLNDDGVLARATKWFPGTVRMICQREGKA